MEVYTCFIETIFTEIPALIGTIIATSIIIIAFIWNRKAKKEIKSTKKASYRLVIYLLFFVIAVVIMLKPIDTWSTFLGFQILPHKELDSRLLPQEVNNFNDIFLRSGYFGSCPGASVIKLCNIISDNAVKQKDDAMFIPIVVIDQLNKDETNNIVINPVSDKKKGKQRDTQNTDENYQQEYIDSLNTLINGIAKRHVYYVIATYQTNGLIDVIQITYNSENKGNELGELHRNKNNILEY